MVNWTILTNVDHKLNQMKNKLNSFKLLGIVCRQFESHGAQRFSPVARGHTQFTKKQKTKPFLLRSVSIATQINK